MERATKIASEEEYRIARTEAQKFERSLASARAREPSPDVNPRIHAAMIESLEGELAIVRKELERYENPEVAALAAREALRSPLGTL